MFSRPHLPASLRVRLVLSLLLATVPAAAAFAFELDQEQERWRAEAEEKHLERAEAEATEQAVFLASLHQLMRLTGQTALGGGDGCEEELSEAWAVQPGVAGMAALGMDGAFVCGVGALRDAPALSSVERVLDGGELATGGFLATDAGPVLDLAAPALNETGQHAGYIALAIDLLWWSQGLAVGQDDSTVAVVDHGGRIVAVNTDPAALGQDITQAPGADEILAGEGRQLVAEGTLWSIAPVPVGPTRLLLAVGDPTAVVYASVPALPGQALAVSTAAFVVALGIVWGLVGRLVVRPVRRLSATAEALGRGDLSARTGMTAAQGEVGRVGAVFDAMGQRLQDEDGRRRQFIGTVAHDLMNPLVPLVLRLHILKTDDSNLTDGQREQVAALERSVLRIKYLVQDLADVNKMEGGRMRIVPADLDLARSVRAVVEEYGPRAREAGVALESRVASAPVHADPVRMDQVLGNLVNNALKFTPEGGTVTVRCTRGADGGARVEVQDTGVGIPPETQDRLFKPFAQLDNPMQSAHKGTGLGLYICKGIVEGHGGAIGIHSEGAGRGTTFWFTLPPASAAPLMPPKPHATGP